MNAKAEKTSLDRKGGLIVLSGPSGSGKTTICRRLAEFERVTLSVSATTRPKRPGEVHGKDYFFLSHEEFMDKVGKGEFVEYNEVFKNSVLYGSLRSELEKGLSDPSRYYLMEIDVRGALNLREYKYDGVYIFIMPPSLEELKTRLQDRKTDDAQSIKGRLEKAEWELQQTGQYDLVVVNDDLDRALAEIVRYLKLA